MSIKIVIDSTTNIAPELKGQFTVVPLTIRFGEKEYIDGVTISEKEFYEKLVESDELPTTSQATPDAFIKPFEEAQKNGDELVVITLSSKLSGTYQSACIAAEDFSNVYVVDSKSVAIGAGILAERALLYKEMGMSTREIVNKLQTEREDIRIIAMLDTLEYLKRGGRISKTVAFAGGVLSIKPVISLQDGEIKILGKARGSRQGNNLLVKEIEAAGGVDFNRPLLLGYTGLSDILLQKYIEDSAFLWQDNASSLRTAIVGSVVGTHTGPGVVAAAFFKKSL